MGLQTNCLEFLVSGQLDGTTPNDIFQRADATSPRPDPPGADPENIYQFEVDDLGIIDLDFPPLAARPDGTVTRGNRYITWFDIRTGGPVGGAGAGINVVGFRPDSANPILQEPIESLVGENGLYLRRCIFVPHGSALQLGPNIEADAGIPIIVRMGVVLPRTRREEELMIQACCCMSRFDPVIEGCLNPPEVDSIDPVQGINGVELTVDIYGNNFQEGDSGQIEDEGASGATVFVDSTHIQYTFTPGGVGDKNVLVIRKTNCVGILVDGFDVQAA